VVSIQSQSLNRYAPNLCCICVDLICDGYYTGRFYHYYSARPIQFHSQHELIVNIDTLCDQLDYPQAALRVRSFWPKRKRAVHRKEMRRQLSKEQLSVNRGNMATFLVHVKYRQNATWQGTVLWAEENKQAHFRSALELIKLMDSAVEEILPDQESLSVSFENHHNTTD